MSKEVATKSTDVTAYDAELQALMHADAGMNISTAERDNLVPAIKVLQAGSPEVQEGEPDYVPGAVAGDFYLPNNDPNIIKGKEGFLFQPCGVTEWWFEFIPRENGGGFVNRYPFEEHDGQIVPPEGAEKYPDRAQRWYFPANGNSCTHYKFVAGLMWKNQIGLEFVIPFFSTGHTVAKAWNTKWLRKKFPDHMIMPPFSHLYHLTTTRRSNKHGNWFAIETDEGLPLMINGPSGNMTVNPAAKKIVGDVMQTYYMARALATAFVEGKKMEAQVATDQTAEAKEEIPF